MRNWTNSLYSSSTVSPKLREEWCTHARNPWYICNYALIMYANVATDYSLLLNQSLYFVFWELHLKIVLF